MDMKIIQTFYVIFNPMEPLGEIVFSPVVDLLGVRLAT